ncbi:disease resistance protein (TIR-NBS-LRR class) [Medicago truncatula]|uniref:ADP-ribosyl cyclase/cyclic ADP-ribose hydrolase n=1 Tax=Medicago truncatula TaxID=3880 RepID=A0A072TVQ1_MEDTR|nr:disease resistance protein (TIR-NBS-LRR class) [Medicago truncatula]
MKEVEKEGSFCSQSKKNDVFISFRGEDTRSNFTSHLHAALCRTKVKTYIDYNLKKGDYISETLVKAIQDSYVSIVVFSENYASSTWCLDELTHMMKCLKNNQIVVVPVFYNVDPSHVRKQSGSYMVAFEKHVCNLNHFNKVNDWREALAQATSLAGWDSRKYMLESELVEDIVQDVLQKLHCKYPSESKGLVGIDKHYAHLESFMSIGSKEVGMIGMWGMGGIGKTTIAAAIFDLFSSQFEGCCFLENIGDESERHGLNFLHNKLLTMLLEEKENVHVGTVRIGFNYSKSRLSHKKVLIVLDDVRTIEQLDFLVGAHTCLGPGSRVIVTARDKHALIERAHEIYEVKPLNFHESLQLFSLSAFKKVCPDIGYQQLSESVVNYAGGIPLALKVLGSLFSYKSKEIWQSTMTKLKKIPCREIQNILRLSYDGLDDTEKEIFLDIACFLNGKDRQHVTRLLDACGFYAVPGLETLLEKALITFSNNNQVQMHALIQEMGREIVRQESTKDPGRRSRLYDHEEVYDVLKNNMGTSAIEGISLDVSQIKDMNLSSDIFVKMINLRFLKFYSRSGERCSVSLPAGLKSFSNKLRYLHWSAYPLKSLPSSFSPEKLVELYMPNSRVKRLWEGVQDLTNLKKMDLSCCENLIELPDFSMASNLQTVNLSRCVRLRHVHASILSLQKLVNLNLVWCKNLKSLLSNTPLNSLRILELYGCSSLKEFSVTSEEMTYLDLRCTAINELPPSVKYLGRLMNLELSSCVRLRNLPNEFSCLKSLGCLVLSDCTLLDTSNLHLLFDGLRSLGYLCLDNCCNLTELPHNISLLSSLYYLSLSGSNVKNIPKSIKHLSQLESLDLCKCMSIQYLPELPPSIEVLDVTNCTSLETVFTCPAIDELLQEHKVFISFKNCVELNEYSRNGIMLDAQVRLKEAAYVDVSAKIEGSESDPCFFFKSEATSSYHHPPTVICPGSRVPDWFHYRSTEASITIELSVSHSPQSNIFGFIFCLILPQSLPNEKNLNWKIGCECYMEGGENIRNTSMCSFATGLVSDHVYLWYDENFCFDMFNTTGKSRTNDDYSAYKPKLSFQFFVETEDKMNVVIKECGICQIYGSEYLSFVEQLGFELELGNQAKRCRDIYELESSETGTQVEGCFENEDEQKDTLHQTKKQKLEEALCSAQW